MASNCPQTKGRPKENYRQDGYVQLIDHPINTKRPFNETSAYIKGGESSRDGLCCIDLDSVSCRPDIYCSNFNTILITRHIQKLLVISVNGGLLFHVINMFQHTHLQATLLLGKYIYIYTYICIHFVSIQLNITMTRPIQKIMKNFH